MSVDKAVRLREAGLSIREIARLMDLPVSTVGDWVKGIAPLEYAELDDETPEERRLRLLTKRCSQCERVLPWSSFNARERWPDGSMRRPYSNCKDCRAAYWRERRRRDPEWAKELNRRQWQRTKAGPDKLARRRELTRENTTVYRLRRREEGEAA